MKNLCEALYEAAVMFSHAYKAIYFRFACRGRGLSDSSNFLRVHQHSGFVYNVSKKRNASPCKVTLTQVRLKTLLGDDI